MDCSLRSDEFDDGNYLPRGRENEETADAAAKSRLMRS